MPTAFTLSKTRRQSVQFTVEAVDGETQFSLPHNLNSRAVVVQVRDAALNLIDSNIGRKIVDENTVQVNFGGDEIHYGAYHVTVIG